MPRTPKPSANGNALYRLPDFLTLNRMDAMVSNMTRNDSYTMP